jgi:hypothetical protein
MNKDMTSEELYKFLEDAGIDFAVLDIGKGVRILHFWVNDEGEGENA